MTTIFDAFATAIRHHQAGRLHAAEQLYRQILAAEPNHADALRLLGLIASQLGNHEAAVEYISRAIELQGNVPFFHNNLGEAYAALGKISEAVACYRRALELKSDFAEAHGNLGNALSRQGQFDEAATSFRRVLALQPEHAETHNNLGNVLRAQGKLDEAIACYQRAIAIKPGFTGAFNNLGVAFSERGKPNDAVASWRRALSLDPRLTDAYINLGLALKERGILDEAVACYRRALELQPQLAEVLVHLGVALKDQGRLDEAVACYRQAIAIKPGIAEAHANLGNALTEQGDLKVAEDFFRAALRYDPGFAPAHYRLATLLRDRLSEADLATQRQLLQKADLTAYQRWLLYFGLAHALDARGQYAEAAEQLDCANALQLAEWRRRGQEYDPEAHAQLVARMIAICTPEFFTRVGGFGSQSEVPVFVVGLPRSGTTLVEQILGRHSQVFAAGELPFSGDTMNALGDEGPDSFGRLAQLDGATARDLAARHLERLRGLHSTAARIVDKMPDNYLFLGPLAALFPRARFIHCRRDLRDVAVSCWMTPFHDARWTNDRGHIASRFHEYRRIMDHWRIVLPSSLLEIDYEDTVTDLEGTARRLVAWCGLEWEPACLDFHRGTRVVRTASAVQVRQPVFATSVGRWRHYENALGSLFAELQLPEETAAEFRAVIA